MSDEEILGLSQEIMIDRGWRLSRVDHADVVLGSLFCKSRVDRWLGFRMRKQIVGFLEVDLDEVVTEVVVGEFRDLMSKHGLREGIGKILHDLPICVAKIKDHRLTFIEELQDVGLEISGMEVMVMPERLKKRYSAAPLRRLEKLQQGDILSLENLFARGTCRL